jgi:DNA repair exonuclease SbcCD nuclease subunit
MKILCFSDVHLDWITQGVSRYAEISSLVDSIVDKVEEEDVDVVVFAGDMSDPDSGPVVFRALRTMLLLATRLIENQRKFIVVAGNHDVIEDGSGTTTLSPLTAFKSYHLAVFEQPGVVDFVSRRGEKVRFVALPFTATSHPYDPVEFMRRVVWHPGAKAVVISHLTVPGIVPGEEVLEMPRGREVLYPVDSEANVSLILQGHYHRRQYLNIGKAKTPMQVIGSMVTLCFGEAMNTPGYIIVEV